MSKLSKVAAIAAVAPLFALASPAFADVSYGQIESGDIYRVKNVTLNGDGNGNFADSITAQCGQTVAFRVRVHNVGPDTINNVMVAATLDNVSSMSHSSKVSLTADNVLDNATITAAAGLTTDKNTTISYVNGSTELLDQNGNEIKSLADGVTTSGINIGSIGPLTSNAEEVQFEAKLNCETPPVKPPKTPTKPTKPAAPKQLVNTGAGDVAGIFAVATLAGFLGYRVVLSRKFAR